jgi:Fic-DOC domain mobile mystery protein B
LSDPLSAGGDGQTPLDPDEAAGLRQSWISTRDDLNQAELQNIISARRWIRRRRLDVETLLDESFVRELHRRMFGDVWAWAGTYRRSDKNIGVPWRQVTEDVGQLLGDASFWVEHQTCEPDELAIRFHYRLAVIHPFPNGNGRHARLSGDLLVRQLGRDAFSWGAGLQLDNDEIRARYVGALREADAQQGFEALVAFARS